MKDFVTFIVKQIVDNPDAVEVIENVDQPGFVDLQVSVDPNDMGKVIGKEGRIIRSLRDLVRVIATKQQVRFNLSIKE
jgi:predicted RNA-binding protein YlqC (UPF0109 family)